MLYGASLYRFSYDGSGQLYSINFKGEMYYYFFNVQGDVIGLYDSDLNVVVRYTYDSWGKVLSVTGSLAGTLGQANPFRYRGYYYDSESGLYYLNSRYYDPEDGRFINADGYASTGQGLLGSNMFAYCGNNPVNRADPTGCCWIEDIFNKVVSGIKKFVTTAVTYFQLKKMQFNNITVRSAIDCVNAMEKNNIDTVEEKAHFFSQCYVEGNSSLLEAGYLSEERAEAYRKQQRYYPYYGAGYIQLTWDYNYKAFSEYMNDPLIYEIGPKYVASNYAWSAAGWFWNYKGINGIIANGASVSDVTRIVNGGYNKLSERQKAYNKFYGILGGY